MMCKHCGGLIAARNPTGSCDHLYWPDNLSVAAKLANGLEQPLPTAIEALRLMRDTTQSRQQYDRAVAALKQMGVRDE